MAELDAVQLVRRLKRLYTSWKDAQSEEPWENVDGIAVIYGKDEVMYSKSTTFQLWLFGYELTDTLCVFCEEEVHILTSKKKVDFLQPMLPLLEQEPDMPTVKMHLRNKEDADKSNIDVVCAALKASGSGQRIGIFAKDRFTGDFVDGWKAALDATEMEQVDVSSAFALLTSVKEEAEVELTKKACQITCQVFGKYVKREIVTIVDEDKKVKHSKLAEGIEQSYVQNPQLLPAGTDTDSVELCYDPIIQSGGEYQLKFSTVSNDEHVHFGTIMCSFGFRYKSYCSNIVRTLFVEPSETKKDNYEFLLELYEEVLGTLTEGAVISDVYQAGVSFVESRRPDLKPHLVKNFGFATGIEFREGSLLIGPKCAVHAKEGMTFNLSVGFAQLRNPSSDDDDDSAAYALFIGDTVQVQKSGPATELTGSSKKKLKSIAIFLGDEEDGAAAPTAVQIHEHRGTSKILESRTRSEMPAEDKRKAHQTQLARHMNDEAKKRLLEQNQTSDPKKQKRPPTVAYKNPAVFPKEGDIQNHKIFVDQKYETVVLPMHGTATPFHISTIKNISRSEEGDYVYLRVNFFCPGIAIGRTEETYFPNPEMSFVKEISLRSTAAGPSSAISNFGHAYQMIKDVQKAFKTREAEKREMEGVMEQASLVLNTSKGNPRLKDLYMRPLLGARRIQGTLEAHVNGFRYMSIKNDRVDIIYNNIKHAIFQPSKGEMILLLHFHLKHPIIIGKKKHRDIQFYTEVGEVMTDLGRSHSMRDRDDLLAEQAERELRAKLDNAFDSFRKKVESLPQSHLSFEVPFRELGFHGVPFRSTVLLQPTTNCIVNLTEQPPFIVTLDDLELVHFERVQFHMKNVDLVFVFKDYKRKVAMVNAIPMNALDSVKDWLNSCDIKYTEGIQSLNWSKIMKTICDDPEGFFESGGWSFLDPESDKEDHASDDDEEMESEDYCPSDDDDDDGAGESDSDEDYTDISENSEEEEFSEEEESAEESGKDWDDLEEEARQADKEHQRFSDEDEDSRRKRPAPSSNRTKSKRPAHSPAKHGRPTSKHGHPPSKHGRSPSKHGRSPSKHVRSPVKHSSKSSSSDKIKKRK